MRTCLHPTIDAQMTWSDIFPAWKETRPRVVAFSYSSIQENEKLEEKMSRWNFPFFIGNSLGECFLFEKIGCRAMRTWRGIIRDEYVDPIEKIESFKFLHFLCLWTFNVGNFECKHHVLITKHVSEASQQTYLLHLGGKFNEFASKVRKGGRLPSIFSVNSLVPRLPRPPLSDDDKGENCCCLLLFDVLFILF